MAFLFQKFLEGVKILAKSSTFARDPRKIQFEEDINRLFLYTCYNRLGKNVQEADAEEIIDMASKAPFLEQHNQVQENIHSQVKNICNFMDEILCSDKKIDVPVESRTQSKDTRPCDPRLAVGSKASPVNHPAVPETNPFTRSEISQRLKDLVGYSLDLKPSQIPRKEAGQGLFLDGEAEVGSVIAFYPGVIYSPAYYRYIPGYPRVDTQNPYLISRYDSTMINAQPWGTGGETREVWNGLSCPEMSPNTNGGEEGSNQFWKVLNKPLEGGSNISEVLERRNPLALAHFANHPAKGMDPNVLVCPYDFPLNEKEMRPYIPNISFGDAEVDIKRSGNFWFKSGISQNVGTDVPVLKSLVLVASRALCDEEILLNYRLSNSTTTSMVYSG